MTSLRYSLIPAVVMAASFASAQECEDEQRALNVFAAVAGSFDPDFEPSAPLARKVAFPRDDIELNGYVIGAQNERSEPVPARGFILVVPGNAMLAEHIVDDLEVFAQAGFDVHVYDFRGFGQPELGGPKSIRSVVEDLSSIVADLRRQYAGEGHVYAMSGGAVMLLMLESGLELIDRIVLDGVPADINGPPKLRFFFIPLPGGRLMYDLQCPDHYQPINNLPTNLTDYMILQGGKDKVVRYDEAEPLLDLAAQRTRMILVQRKWDHPFRGKYRDLESRLAAVAAFFSSGQLDLATDYEFE